MKTIPLTQGKVALVDNEDYEWLNQWKWCAMKQRNNDWYAARKVYKDGKEISVYMHREILKPPANKETDHKDHNGLNNQRHNLRAATRAQNQHNQRKQRGRSRYKGVDWHRGTSKWRARIVVNKQQLYLGLFISEVKAAQSYDEAAQTYFGEYAQSNFVD